MKIEEILNNKLKELYKRLRKTEKILNSNKNRLKQTSESIELIDLFLEDATHIENLRNADTSYLTELLREFNYIEDTNIESELNIIKLLLKGIYDRNLKTSLNEHQKELLKDYINKVSQLFNELSEKKSSLLEDFRSIDEQRNLLEEQIIRIEILLEKINDKEDESILDMEDLDVIRLISEDESEQIKTRRDALIAFIEYNNDRKNGKSKLSKIDTSEVIACFNKYGRNLTRVINKYKDEVEENANIKNINEILEFMSSVGILKRFENVELLTICLYGNVESVQSEFEEVNKKDDDSLYYNVASIWINNIENKKTRKKKYSAREKGEKTTNSLNTLAHQISREEMEKNIEYLRSEGFEFDTEVPGTRKTITTSNIRLREAVNAFKLYGIINEDNVSKFKVWLLSEPQVVEKLDRFVELGLLGGHNGPREYVNYLKRYTAKLHNMEYPVYLLLYKIKQTYPNDSYYEAIASSKNGQLAGDLNSGRLDDALDTPEEIEFYRLDNFVSPEEKINNYLMYEELINTNYDVKISDDIFNTKEIQDLEANHRVEDNPYIYIFDNVVISRIKVLRNYSLIHDGTKESLMSSIVKGSFLTEESYQKIAQSIDYTLGGSDGLLKKIQSK